MLVFGARAGRSAAKFAKVNLDLHTTALVCQADDEQERISKKFIRKQGGTVRIASLRQEMMNIMESSAGIFRDESTLKDACNKLADLKGRFSNILIEDRSLTFNTELTSALELENMLDLASTITHAALERRESRGAHQRTDFPDRDDERFLKSSLSYWTGEEPRIGHREVTITKWPPGERVYGTPAETKNE